MKGETIGSLLMLLDFLTLEEPKHILGKKLSKTTTFMGNGKKILKNSPNIQTLSRQLWECVGKNQKL